MGSQSEERTHASLFSRLRREPENEQQRLEFQKNWTEFVKKYGPMVHAWCRQRGLNEPDTNDVTQDVLVRFIRALRSSFTYDPSRRFRGLLQKVTNNVVNDFLKFLQRDGVVASQNDHVLRALEGEAAREDLARRLMEQFDLELFETAKLLVQQKVQPDTWAAYVRTVELGQDPAAVAGAIGKKIENVYKAKSNVIRELRETVKLLQAQEDWP